MRKNDIENIARILRKKALVRTGTIVGFENDGKVVQVRFHDTKLPEGQFERKLACEGIIEGSTFTLIQPNFRRPVSDLVDVEKEVGAGSFKGLTLPLVGFETYPEGSENPDCIIGLFELPGGSIYKEVLTEAGHDILIPGYGTFPSQKVIGEDEIRRIELSPWFGPYRIGEFFRLATITNARKELTSLDDSIVIGFPFVDKVASIRTRSDEILHPDLEFETFDNDVLSISDFFDPEAINEDPENRHLLFTSGIRLFFCEGIATFKYWERIAKPTYSWYSTSPYPHPKGEAFGRARVINVFSEDGIYTKKGRGASWGQSSYYGDPYEMGGLSNFYDIYGYFIVNKIMYDLSKNTVKLEGDSHWLEEPQPFYYQYYLPTESVAEISYLNDPEIEGKIAIVNKSGKYLGSGQVVSASEYENNSRSLYLAYASESDPVMVRVRMPYRTEFHNFYERGDRTLVWSSDIKAVGETMYIIDTDVEIGTSETQVLLAEGPFRPSYVLDIPSRMNEIATPDGLIYHWLSVEKLDRPYYVPHLVSRDTGIVSSFLSRKEWENGEREKNEIELKLSNIDLPINARITPHELVKANVINQTVGTSLLNPFFRKDVSSLGGTGFVREVAGMIGLGIMNWSYDVKVFNEYALMGVNTKGYGGKLDRTQIKEMFFKGTVVNGKPYKMPSIDFTDPNVLMENTYGERNPDDYGANPSNTGLVSPQDTYKVTMPRYDTGANATYRWDPDDVTIEIDYIELYKLTGASYDHWVGRWTWYWEAEPYRIASGEEIEKVEPYPRVRVPITAGELTEIGGRWHAPRARIHYKRLKCGTYGLNCVPYFYVHFTNPAEALAEFTPDNAGRVIWPGVYHLFEPLRGDHWIDVWDKIYPVVIPIYGPISFPETDDPLFNSIRNDMTGIVGVSGISRYLIHGTRARYWVDSTQVPDYAPLRIDWLEGKDEAFWLPLRSGDPERVLRIIYRYGGFTEDDATFEMPAESLQEYNLVFQHNDLDYIVSIPANFKLRRFRFDRAKLIFPKLMLQDDLSSTVINLDKFGSKEV